MREREEKNNSRQNIGIYLFFELIYVTTNIDARKLNSHAFGYGKILLF